MHYVLYKHDLIPCCFCGKHVNLYYSKTHLKTKHCVALQKLINEEERNNLFVQYCREINRLKGELLIK